MFCSAKCCTDSYKKFNGKDDLIQDSLRGDDIRQKMLRIMSEAIFAAGSFSELENLVENIDRKTVFDYDFSDPNDDKFNMKILACISSLMPKEDCGVAEYLNIILTLPNGPKKDFFVKFISRVILNYMRNGVKLPGKGTNLPDGGMLLPFVSIVNHSCDPNIFVTFIDTKCVFVVIRCIKAGEQIFDNYRYKFFILQCCLLFTFQLIFQKKLHGTVKRTKTSRASENIRVHVRMHSLCQQLPYA